MSNEEFQRIVLEKLGNIENKIENLDNRVGNLEKGQEEIKMEQLEMKKEQQEMKKQIKSIIEQTAGLIEFRYEINAKIDQLSNDINSVEIITSQNWNDIARLKAAR